MFPSLLFVALLAQSPSHASYGPVWPSLGSCPLPGPCVSYCTVGPVTKSPDAPLYYLCRNAHGEPVTVEHEWFIEHCHQRDARSETEYKIAADCNAYAPRFGPVSEAGRDQSRDDPAKPKEPFSSKLKRWGLYAAGAAFMVIYIYGKSR